MQRCRAVSLAVVAASAAALAGCATHTTNSGPSGHAPRGGTSSRGAPAALLVFAHPDDETMAAGLLARLRDRGVALHGLYVTRGEGGTVRERDANGAWRERRRPPALVARRRRGELCRAAAMLRLRSLRVLGDPDRPMHDSAGKPTRDVARFLAAAAWNVARLRAAIRQAARATGAQLIVTTLPRHPKIHAHHQAVGRVVAALLAHRALGGAVTGAIAVHETDWYPTGTFPRADSDLAYARTDCCAVDGRSYGVVARAIAAAHVSQPTGHQASRTERSIEVFTPLGDKTRVRATLARWLRRPRSSALPTTQPPEPWCKAVR